MAFILNKLWNITSLLPKSMTQIDNVRTKFSNCRMLKDYRKRKTIQLYGQHRLRVNSLRKNLILPPELREMADAEIAALPRNGSITRVIPRCVLTSRPKGTVKNYRISRIMWRHLADYNQLSGVQRAIW